MKILHHDWPTQPAPSWFSNFPFRLDDGNAVDPDLIDINRNNLMDEVVRTVLYNDECVAVCEHILQDFGGVM